MEEKYSEIYCGFTQVESIKSHDNIKYRMISHHIK